MVFGPVNDPLTTRGHFAAVIDGRCPSRGFGVSSKTLFLFGKSLSRIICGA